MKLKHPLLTGAAAILLAFPSLAFPQAKNGAAKGASLLEQTSQAFTQIAEKAIPATVFIKAQSKAQTFQQSDPFESFNPFAEELFRHFFGAPPGQQQAPQQQTSGGSGFFVSSDGFLVTNYHVIKDAEQITVILNDGREFPASVTGTDPRTDLAVLKINETNLPYLVFGDSDKLKIGEWVIAIGAPFALESSLTVGVVSAKDRQDLGITPLENFIQTDAAINPGNSGGALLNLEGDVIGVNTAIISRSGGYMGIGFSIPSKMTQNVINQIMNTGNVKRAYLGIMLQQIDKELSDALGLEKQEGILIAEVLKGSPADKGGLQQGDIITQYNDIPVKSVAKFRNEIALMSPGDQISLTLLRNNAAVQLKLPLGVQSDSETVSAELVQKIGIEVENITPEIAAKFSSPEDIRGVVISKVKQGSPAAAAGLKPGFVITGVVSSLKEPSKEIRTAADFDAALKSLGNRKHIILIVRHQSYQRYYTLKMD